MDVLIVSGAPGSGKSTISEALAHLAPKGAHIPVDFFRKMVKGGYASPHHWNDEVTLQYRLARKNAAATARNLAQAGFLCVLDDIVPPDWVADWREDLDGLDIRWVLIRPPLEVALRRNRERDLWTVDEQVLRDLFAMFDRPYEIEWLKIDNSTIEPSEAAEMVLRSLR